MWDLPGGHVEQNETPEQCIVREMKEELNLTLDHLDLFSVDEFEDRIEYTFWQRINFDINQVKLNEGQRIKWFSESEARDTELAYGFNQIVANFFNQWPLEQY